VAAFVAATIAVVLSSAATPRAFKLYIAAGSWLAVGASGFDSHCLSNAPPGPSIRLLSSFESSTTADSFCVHSLRQRHLEDMRKNVSRVKPSLSDFTRYSTVTLIALVDACQRFGGPIEGGEAEQPLIVGQERTRTCVLNDCRLSTR
jgi:hypothetical protein